MNPSPSFRQPLFRLTVASMLFASLGSLAAHAESKDMIQLQTQIQQLQDAVARLQQSNDERMGVLKDLVQQTADSVNKMSVAVNGLQLGMQNQQEAATAKNEQVSGQIQSLNDSLDELKARMARMEKALNEIQSQQQSTNAMLGNLPQGGGGASAPPPSPAPENAAPAADNPAPIVTAPSGRASAGDLYRSAYADYMSAKYPLAASEFSDLIKAYPDDNLSGNAYFYVGEIDVRTQKLTAAVKSYDQVLERYPDNSKIPAAHLHKAYAMIAMKQNDKASLELRALIQRFPNSPEASQARAKLNTLKPSAGRE
jgi:tol-pal system protein YbgF